MPYYVYIATNKNKSVLYTGVTDNLPRRIFEHQQGVIEGFTQRYNVSRLIYAGAIDIPIDAIVAEKKIKGWTRAKRVALIEAANPDWDELRIDGYSNAA